MRKKKNTGKFYENKVYNTLKWTSPNGNVRPDVRIVGKLSESSRQLDVILRDPNSYDFIAFECKDESTATGTPVVEAYATKLKDVGAKHGAIVSNSAFSKGAQKMAAKLDIDLLHLIDSGDPQIRTKLLAQAGTISKLVKRFTIIVPKKDFPYNAPNYGEVVVIDNGVNKTLMQLAADIWKEIASTAVTGTVTKNIENLKINIKNEEIPLNPLQFIFDIEVEYRSGIIDITNTRGIYNVKSHIFQTDSIAFSPISAEIIKGWGLVPASEWNTTSLSLVLYTYSDLLSSQQTTKPKPFTNKP